MSLFGRMLKCVHLVDFQHRAAFGGYYWDHFSMISSRISMFAMWIMSTAITETLVSSTYIVCATFRCWDSKKMMTCRRHVHFADMQPFCWSYFVWLFIFGYFINMHYGHIASDKGASICEKSAIFRYSSVDFTYRKNIPVGNMIGKR